MTSNNGRWSKSSEERDILLFELSTELMGCSDNGVAEISDIGVEITSTHEIAVQVYNLEADTEDYYTAIPLNILSTDYYGVSMSAVNEISELIIIATENGTIVDLTLPSFTTAQVTLNSDTKSAGETLSFTLQKREAFHVAVTDSSVAESVVGMKVHSSKPVSVISGNRKYMNDHLADAIPPISKLGKHYVLIPADPEGDGRATTYVIQATTDGDTVVTQYLTSTTTQNFTYVKII